MKKCTVITFSNLRGGPGKTTSAILSAHILSENKTVLCIDCDPQASLSRYYNTADKKNITLINFLLEGNKKAIRKINNNLHYIASNIELVDMAENEEFIKVRGKEILLLNALNKIKTTYDYILIDCPPALSIITVNALIASDIVICPVDLDIDSFTGADKLIKNIESIRNDPIGFMMQLKSFYILPTKYKSLKKFDRKFLSRIKNDFTGDIQILPEIRYCDKVRTEKENNKIESSNIIKDYKLALKILSGENNGRDT